MVFDRREYQEAYLKKYRQTQKYKDSRKAFYEANKKRLLEEKKEYRELNREELLVNKKEWYRKNATRLKVKAKKYRDSKPIEHWRAIKQKWRDNNREKYRAYITPYNKARYRRLREEAATRPRPDHCEMCGEVGPVVYDHNHDTGNFRGWPCNRHNRGLGFFHDSIEELQMAIDYLKKYDR